MCGVVTMYMLVTLVRRSLVCRGSMMLLVAFGVAMQQRITC